MDCLSLLQQDIDAWNQWRAEHPAAPCSLGSLDLSQGYFFDGNFSSVDLSGADLRRACLIGADFRYANLAGADLSEAYLGEAVFWGANLSGVKLAGAHVERTNFEQAIGLRADQLKTVAPDRELLVAAPVEGVEHASRSRDIYAGESVSALGVRQAITQLRLGPIAHEERLFRMMASVGSADG